MMPDAPQRRDPPARTPAVPLPPAARSRKAHLLVPPAGRGAFVLPRCAGCGAYAWPVPEACPACLGAELPLTPAPRGAAVIAATTAEVPAEPYFRARAPWRVGLVAMDCGPRALVHLHPAAGRGDRVLLSLVLDRAGQAVLHAGAEGETDMGTDPQFRQMADDPAGRSVLITDARHAAALPLAEALLAGGARQVWLGLDEAGKPFAQAEAVAALEGAALVPLDLRSDRSVSDLARDIGGRVEILVNTADLPRPGPVTAPAALAQACETMEVAAFGLMRLARNFAPIMAARGAGGPASATAWVNLVPVMARVPHPGFAGYGAAHAAALALAPALRAVLGAGGVRLMTALTGPTESEGFDAVPSPRVTGHAIAAAIVAGLKAGREEVVIGDLARDWLQRHEENPRALAAELAQERE